MLEDKVCEITSRPYCYSEVFSLFSCILLHLSFLKIDIVFFSICNCFVNLFSSFIVKLEQITKLSLTCAPN